MKRRDWLAAAAAWATGPLAMAAETAAPPLSAERIVEKNLAARGGGAAWRAVTAVSYTGELDAGGKKETRLPFTLTLQRPHKSRLEIKFQGRTAVQVYDGQNGWKWRPFLNREEVEPYSTVELQEAAEWDELDGALIDHQRKGIKVAYAGTEAVDGRSCYKLRLTGKGGRQRLLWVDAKTFLEARIEGQPRKLDGRPHGVLVYFRDYRSVGGLMVPHELETTVVGAKNASHKMSIQAVKANPQLLAGTFAKPKPGAETLAAS